MALIDCRDFPEIPDFTKIVFANGTVFETALTSLQDFPNSLDLNLSLLQNRLLPGTAGVRPVIDLIEMVTGIFTCLTNLTDAITGLAKTPPDPSGIGNAVACLGDVQGLLQKVLEAHPSIWVPLCIIKFIDALILILDGFIAQIQRIVADLTRITQLFDLAAQFNQQYAEEVLSCAQRNNEKEALTVQEAIRGLGAAFALINAFATFVGLEPICFTAPSPGAIDLSVLLDTLGTLQSTLLSARGALSVPSLALSIFNRAQTAGGACPSNTTIEDLGLESPPALTAF